MKKLTKANIFKLKAKKVHGDKYDYSKVKYKDSYTKVSIICKTHGVFHQTPSVHLTGSICFYCARNRLTEEQFLEKANKIHNNKYDYNNSGYSHHRRKNTSIAITCPKHGKFHQRIDLHLKGNGCPSCGKAKRSKSRAKNAVARKEKKQPTLAGSYILKVRYSLKENPVKVELISNSFPNRADAANHLEEVKDFLSIIDGKIHESKVDVLPVVKQPETADENKHQNKSGSLKKILAMPKFMRAIFSYF